MRSTTHHLGTRLFLSCALLSSFCFSGVVSAAVSGDDRQPPAPAARESDDFNLERPNAVYAELLGRAGLYSLGYDRMITSSVALGFGFSYFSVSGGDIDGSISASVFIIPVYVNFYLNQGTSRGFLTGGMDLVLATASASDSYGNGITVGGSGVVATLGGGYELRTEGGFLLRVAPYLLIGGGSVQVWGGLSVGGAF